MHAIDILRKKRDGHPLAPAEIEAFVAGATSGSWPDYQVAALLMAIYQCGMTEAETAHLTRAMVESGSRLDLSDLPGPKADKHSTGGVGDKTSLILAPLAAACGVIVPMMSGRGLGHSGGTLDKLEAIPGFRVSLSLDEVHNLLQRFGLALVGPTAEVAPADRKLYALRDVTATIESIPLITASIMSKKLAEGIDALVLDVKVGQGAFLKDPAEAETLARHLVATGEANCVRTRALLTAMDVPLGRAVGNALEVREAIATLRGEGPAELETLSVTLAAHMLLLSEVAWTIEEAEAKVCAALGSGRGLERLRDVISAQGGDAHVVDDPGRLPAAPHVALLRAERSGFVSDIHAERVGRACVLLGAGRQCAEDTVDPAVGVIVRAECGDQVGANDVLAEVHYRSERHLPEALDLLRHAWAISDAAPAPRPLLRGMVSAPTGSR